MSTVIGVRFKKAGKIYYFNPGKYDIKVNDGVIVETIRGIEYGDVVVGPKEVEDFKTPLKDVIRIATEKDLAQVEENKEKANKAYGIIAKQIEKHKLKMKIIDIEYTFDNNKIIFYFAAEGRIDFRELVKDLAAIFKTRIELRQIGVRDEAKALGGIGPCGRNVCCNLFLGDFTPVSIKMAKEQNLSLSPTKISGLCGRLMCCLNYEEEYYEETRRKMPAIGITVTTPDGSGEVLDYNILSKIVKVKTTAEDGTAEVREYKVENLKWNRKKFNATNDIKNDEDVDPELKDLV